MFTLRTGGFLVLLGFAGLTATAMPAPAWADAPTATASGSQQVTLPTGKTIDAQKFTNPTAGSIEHAIIDSMQLIGAGKLDEWISKYCDAMTCHDAAAKESLKSYQLKSSSKTAHECLTDDGSILVTRRETVEAEGSTRIYVFCGPNRMPAPASLKPVGDGWKVASFSW
jgi:hypothetical protein